MIEKGMKVRCIDVSLPAGVRQLAVLSINLADIYTVSEVHRDSRGEITTISLEGIDHPTRGEARIPTRFSVRRFSQED